MGFEGNNNGDERTFVGSVREHLSALYLQLLGSPMEWYYIYRERSKISKKHTYMRNLAWENIINDSTFVQFMAEDDLSIVATYDFSYSGGLVIDVFKDVYPPGEDTFLIADNISPGPGIRFLEIGVGTGLISILAAKRGAEVCGTDINHHAVSNAEHNAEKNNIAAEFHCCDLFSALSGKFDMIVFNPPYLPAAEGKYEQMFSKWERKALFGGKDGIEVIMRFLEQSPMYLKKEGAMYLVSSSLGDTTRFRSSFSEKYDFTDIAHRDLGNERLTLLMVKWKEEQTGSS